MSDGFGPVLQRDYWAPIRGCTLDPVQLMAWVPAHFAELAPERLCRFESGSRSSLSLDVGEVLDIRIRGAARCQVEVVHRDALSATLATRPGHPEAGKITFGAYPNSEGDVVFHIRSRARARSIAVYLGFALLGEAMQTNTWSDFVDRVALSVGRGPVSVVHAETRLIRGKEAARIEREPDDAPTYLARQEGPGARGQVKYG